MPGRPKPAKRAMDDRTRKIVASFKALLAELEEEGLLVAEPKAPVVAPRQKAYGRVQRFHADAGYRIELH